VYTEIKCENGKYVRKDSVNLPYYHDQIIYHCNGKKHQELKLNKKSDQLTFTEYTDDGKLLLKALLTRDEHQSWFNLPLISLRPNGTWEVYNEKGKKVKEIIYKNHQIVSEKEL
jgi:antitoxin component YwqK of YwqJK toxin-antitoxin module